MSDPVLELHSGSDIVLLARCGAVLGPTEAVGDDCPMPALMRVLSMPDNVFKLRSNWSAVCSETIQIKQLSDDALVEKILAEVALRRVAALRRPVPTFDFVMGKLATKPTPSRELAKERMTPSMRLPSEPELPKTPKLPEAPKVKLPDVPAPADVLPGLPKPPDLPQPPELPELPTAAALEEMAKTAAEQAARMDELAKERALARELLEKADKAREIADKVIALRNASKEEIAAFAMQLAVEYGEDIPPEYREMLREHGTAENIKKAEDKAEKAADTASGMADKF